MPKVNRIPKERFNMITSKEQLSVIQIDAIVTKKEHMAFLYLQGKFEQRFSLCNCTNV